MSEKRMMKREYREAHGAMRFGWSAAKLFNFDDAVLREVRSVFVWQQEYGNTSSVWMVRCTSSNPEQDFTLWGSPVQCFKDAEEWLECNLDMELMR
jgi:hypothetical protein